MLHWVSKILKPLEHAGKKQEVLAISSNIKKQENLRSIVQLEEGEGNAKNKTQRILRVGQIRNQQIFYHSSRVGHHILGHWAA